MNTATEAITSDMVPVKRAAIAPRGKQFTANWQNGFESGGRVQRKLRLTLADMAPQHAVGQAMFRTQAGLQRNAGVLPPEALVSLNI